MGQVLDEFCAENELDSSRYELREILLREVPGHNHITHKHLQPENTLLQGNLRTDMGPTVFERKGILKSTDIECLGSESNTLELVPSDVMQSMVAQNMLMIIHWRIWQLLRQNLHTSSSNNSAS